MDVLSENAAIEAAGEKLADKLIEQLDPIDPIVVLHALSLTLGAYLGAKPPLHLVLELTLASTKMVANVSAETVAARMGVPRAGKRAGLH